MCGRYRRTTSEEELARLYHIPIPNRTDLPISCNQLQHRTESESLNYPIQSGDSGALPRCVAVGPGAPLGRGPQDRVPDN